MYNQAITWLNDQDEEIYDEILILVGLSQSIMLDGKLTPYKENFLMEKINNSPLVNKIPHEYYINIIKALSRIENLVDINRTIQTNNLIKFLTETVEKVKSYNKKLFFLEITDSLFLNIYSEIKPEDHCRYIGLHIIKLSEKYVETIITMKKNETLESSSFDLLHLSKDFNKDQLNKSYRSLSKLYHPDKLHGSSEAKKEYYLELTKKINNSKTELKKYL